MWHVLVLASTPSVQSRAAQAVEVDPQERRDAVAVMAEKGRWLRVI
jgi:hypothetical protein